MIDITCKVTERSTKNIGLITEDDSKGDIIIENVDDEGTVAITIRECGKGGYGPFKFYGYELIDAIEKCADLGRRPVRYQPYGNR